MSLHNETGDLKFLGEGYYHKSSNVTINSQVSMVEQGINPKPMILEFCKPQCQYWKEKLERCEVKLEQVIKIDPTKTCMYPMRDYVTCVEACAQPKIHNSLIGTD